MHPLVAANRKFWDLLTESNLRSAFYDVEGFVAGRVDLDPVVGEALGEVAGRRLLHLQCHFGMDSLALARRGALVTGVDLSPRAVEAARALAARIGQPARFVEADVLSVDLGEDFDLIFSSWGATGWLPDLRPWARVIARHLAPGGRFVLVEGHPVLWMLGETLPAAVKYDYFGGEPIETAPHVGSYADPRIEVPMPEYGWNHSLAETVGVLMAEGLELRRLDEGDRIPWAAFAEMVPDGQYFRLPPGHPRMPLSFTLELRRPAR